MMAHPVPSSNLEALPESLHCTLASLLPDGNKKKNRFRLALVSRTMLRLYGGSLTVLKVGYQDDSCRAAALARLVQKQPGLTKLYVKNELANNALALILAAGCLRSIRKLTITTDKVDCLGDALDMPGVLPALEALRIRPSCLEGGDRTSSLRRLAVALACGAAPSLRVLDLAEWYGLTRDESVMVFKMLEARTRLPACRGLESIRADCVRFMNVSSEEVRCQLLRNMTKLEMSHWRVSYAAYFSAAQPLRVKRWTLEVDEVAAPAVEVWEAMHEVEVLELSGCDLEPVILALNQGVAFQRLLKLKVTSSVFNGWNRFLKALAGATCAGQLVSLELISRNMCHESRRTLSVLLGQDAFPMLQRLSLDTIFIADDMRLDDDGVVVLAQALMAASRTRLVELNLSGVQVGDNGVAAIAKLIRAGRFKRLQYIDLSFNLSTKTVTDQGLYVLARAINDARAHKLLDMLRAFTWGDFDRATSKGFAALTPALINNCPRLRYLYLGRWRSLTGTMMVNLVKGMIQAADCGHRVRFDYKRYRPEKFLLGSTDSDEEEEDDEEDDEEEEEDEGEGV